MRQILLLPVLLMACGSTGTKIAPADVAGTYEGSSMADGTDSVLSTWSGRVTTSSSGALEGKLVDHAAVMDTVPFTQTISGDTVISLSSAYTPAGAATGTPQMQWRSVGRRAGNEWTGTVTIMLAGTDSVVQRAHWKATRTP